MYLFPQVPSREIDKAESRFWTHWNKETKQVLIRTAHCYDWLGIFFSFFFFYLIELVLGLTPLVFTPSSSSSSISRWRSPFNSPVDLHLPWAWSVLLPSWAGLGLVPLMSPCPLLQEGCLFHPSLLVPQAVPKCPAKCPIRCPCPRCQWGHRLQRVWQCLITDLLEVYDYGHLLFAITLPVWPTIESVQFPPNCRFLGTCSQFNSKSMFSVFNPICFTKTNVLSSHSLEPL